MANLAGVETFEEYCGFSSSVCQDGLSELFHLAFARLPNYHDCRDSKRMD
jgi:hypothetical protein